MINIRKMISCYSSLILFSMLFAMTAGQTIAQEVRCSYIHPLPGAEMVNPEQNIILKVTEGFDIHSVKNSHFVITGNKSGTMAFELMFSEDKNTLILKPQKPFQGNEKVEVRSLPGLRTANGNPIETIHIHFTVSGHDRNEIFRRWHEIQAEEMPGNEPGVITQRSQQTSNVLPGDFPQPIVFSYGPADQEYYFVNLNCRFTTLPWNKFICIFDSYGTPVFFEEGEYNCINFHPLQDGTLCYATNIVNNNEHEKYYILDDRYTLIDSVNTGNGYILDAHEMLLLNNGHYLVMSYDPQPVNMSLVVPGGNPNAIVTGLVIQEVDNNQNVFFQWRSWDHFEITDATDDIDLTAPGVDYVHGNAFEIDQDGNILLSSRHLDEITKINFTTGDVNWRFGKNSENNNFLIEDDPTGFTHQHDIERLPNGHYTVFDNGNLRSPQYSQVLEYELDQNNLVATLVWSYRHGPDIYAGSAGSFRTQSNGNRVVGWGGTFPEAITELSSEGSLLRDIHFEDYVNSYRAIKASWETSLFSTQPELSFGNYSGSQGMKENLLFIQNNSNQVISISSTHNLHPEFQVLSDLPLLIFPFSSNSLRVGFEPGASGEFSDRLTLNYDNADTSRRIARQLELRATYNGEVPYVWFTPSFGSVNVPPDTSLLITFSEPVTKALGGEITNGDIPLLVDLKETNSSGADVAFTGIINNEKTQIELFPDPSLQENQDYYLLLKGGIICDFDGNLIALDEECYFSTGLLSSNPERQEIQARVFPNPFSDVVSVITSGNEDHEVSVFTPGGKKIYEAVHAGPRFNIELSGQPQGIYFIRIRDKKSGASMVIKTIKSATQK